MLIIQDILISDEVVAQHFHCNLNICKGACCWKGDFGAPLEVEEIEVIKSIYSIITPFLTDEANEKIASDGQVDYYEEPEFEGTPLLPNGACVYMVYDKLGIAQCAFELAYREGLTTFKKPISCHLYPIRVTVEKDRHFEALNYDDWDICKAACRLGEKKQIAVYEFVKDAIIRKYGHSFYEELDAAAKYQYHTSKR